MSRTINTRTRYKIIGSDYSAQEPRMTTYLSQDKNMLTAYNEGKDLYAMIARSAFNNNYEDNLEFWPEGTELEIDGKKVIAGNKTHKNPAGKERRSVGKVLNLAATYGMGGATAGARLNKSPEEGQQLLDNFFKDFSGVKTAIDYSKQFLKEHRYVEDFVGRRRHLPDYFLPKYEVKIIKKNGETDPNFNPFFICKDRKNTAESAWLSIINAYINRAKYKNPDTDQLSKKMLETLQKTAQNPATASKETLAKIEKDTGIAVPDQPCNIFANTGRIAQSERQCFNARIQGSAATLTKVAMVNIYNNKQMKDYGAKLIIPVHDELLVECPEYYADKVEKLLPDIMINTPKTIYPDYNVPQKCDPYNVNRWYCDEASASLQEEFKKLMTGDTKNNISPLSRDDALEKLYTKYIEFPKEAIYKSCTEGADLVF